MREEGKLSIYLFSQYSFVFTYLFYGAEDRTQRPAHAKQAPCHGAVSPPRDVILSTNIDQMPACERQQDVEKTKKRQDRRRQGVS